MKQQIFLQFILGILFSSFFIVACDSTDLFDTSTCCLLYTSDAADD